MTAKERIQQLRDQLNPLIAEHSNAKCALETQVRDHQLSCLEEVRKATDDDANGEIEVDTAVRRLAYRSATEHVGVGMVAMKRLKKEMDKLNGQIDKLVHAPAEDGCDRTLWLPDELMLMILTQVIYLVPCSAVCRRWWGLCKDPTLVKLRERMEGRWQEYASGFRAPATLWTGSRSAVRAITVSDDGRLFTGSADGTVQIWRGGRIQHTIDGHTDWVRALLSPTSEHLYSGSDDNNVKLWSAVDGSHIRTLVGHSDGVTSLAATHTRANGLVVFAGSKDTTITGWCSATGTHLHTLRGHTHGVMSLATDGRDKLFSGSADTTIRVWSASMAIQLYTLLGHTDWVSSLVIAPDGALISASWDHRVCVWAGTDNSIVSNLFHHFDPVRCLAMSSRGVVVSVSSRGRGRVWLGGRLKLSSRLSFNAMNIVVAAAGADGRVYTANADSARISVW